MNENRFYYPIYNPQAGCTLIYCTYQAGAIYGVRLHLSQHTGEPAQFPQFVDAVRFCQMLNVSVVSQER